MFASEIAEALELDQPRIHVPAFRVEPDPLGWRIFDGEEDLAVFGTHGYLWYDIFRLEPGGYKILANVEPPRKVVDLHTLHNTAMNLPYTNFTEIIAGFDRPSDRMTSEWISDAGDALHLRIQGEFNHGERIEYNLTVGYAPSRGQYVWGFDCDVWKLSPTGGEPLNMMMAGALASRPEERRWSHSLWVDPFGKLRHMVHSNALFTATDYAPAEWRRRNAPQQGAWMAYATHDTYNPCLLVTHTSPAVRFAICSQLFDEHVIWQDAGFDDLDEDGFFHFTMSTELVNMPADLAASALDRAAAPPRPKQWTNQGIALPFYHDIVNDLETPIDPWLPEECPMIHVENTPSATIQWVCDAAHSGSHSLRFSGTSKHGRTALFPSGAVFLVAMNTRYTFSAWVKTEHASRFARLELFSYEYTFNNTIDIAQSKSLTGTNDWTRLEVSLDSADQPYIMPRMELYGTGTAWFDDLQLVRAD